MNSATQMPTTTTSGMMPMMGGMPGMMNGMMPMMGGMPGMMGGMMPMMGGMPGMMNGMMPMMGGMPGMMGGMPGMMPMMMCRMSCEMGKDGMVCKVTPMDPSQLDMIKSCCDAMTSAMSMGMPCMMMCAGMPMMCGMPMPQKA